MTKEEKKARRKEWYEKNKDRIKERQTAYREQHREEYNARATQWQRENRERVSAQARERYWKNHEKSKADELERQRRRLADPEKRAARNAYEKAWRDKPENREKIIASRKNRYERLKAQWREKNLKKKYGITAADYNAMFEAQGGLCAICKGAEGSFSNGGGLHVDHNHTTNKVRKLLCGSCNNGIGNFHENIETLLAAAAYLKEFIE